MAKTDNPLMVDEDDHCDMAVEDYKQPNALRWWILINRLPAVLKLLAHDMGAEPKLFADWKDPKTGKMCTVRCVMASRFGDIGITHDLNAEHGYITRVLVSQLENPRSTVTP